MSEINLSTQDKGKRQRMKKAIIRIDLTPMVDLGFLLITFFIFTTSMSEPKSMKLKLPADPKPSDSSQVAEGKTLNLIIDENNRVFYYMGKNIVSLNETSFQKEGIRKIIIDKKINTGKIYRDLHELVILIKPTKRCSYQSIVRILDEMVINDVTRYMLMEPGENELAQLQTPNQ